MGLLKFNHGPVDRLPNYSTETVGNVYITKDSHEMKVDLPDGRISISDFIIVDDQTALEEIGTYHENLFYYLKTENLLKKYTKVVGEGESNWKTLNDVSALADAIAAFGLRLIKAEDTIFGTYDATTETRAENGLIHKTQTLQTTIETMDASKIKTNKTFKVTKAVGNYSVGEIIELTDIQKLIEDMLSEDVNPTRHTWTSASISLTGAGAKEVGYEFTPKFSFNTNGGKYAANGVVQEANVTYNSFYVEETGRPNGASSDPSTSSSGSFAKFTVTDGTNYKLTGSCKSTDGDIPKTYLGEDYDKDGTKEIRFMEQDWKNLSSGTVTGYRAMFYGYFDHIEIADPSKITSAQVRALSGTVNTGTEGTPTWTVLTGPQKTLPSGKKEIKTNKMQQMFFAAKKGTYSKVEVANSTNGAPQTVTKITDIMVEGLNGYEATAYDVFYVSNAGPESGETIFDVTLS